MILKFNKGNRIITAPFQKQSINDSNNNNIQNQIQEDGESDINYLNFQFQSLDIITNLEFEKV